MAFQGDVAHIPISNIVQALYLNAQEGVLSVENKTLKYKLHVLRLGIRPLSTLPGKADVLRLAVVKERLLTESEFQNAMSSWSPGKTFPGDFLLRRRVITADQVRNEIRKQLEEIIHEVLTASDLRYEFSVGEECLDHEIFDPDGLGSVFIYNVNGLLMEAARRDDEWQRIRAVIPAREEIFVPAHKRLPDVVPKEAGIAAKTYKEPPTLFLGAPTTNVSQLVPMCDPNRSPMIPSGCGIRRLSTESTHPACGFV